jgi:hypothetical protein
MISIGFRWDQLQHRLGDKIRFSGKDFWMHLLVKSKDRWFSGFAKVRYSDRNESRIHCVLILLNPKF